MLELNECRINTSFWLKMMMMMTSIEECY